MIAAEVTVEIRRVAEAIAAVELRIAAMQAAACTSPRRGAIAAGIARAVEERRILWQRLRVLREVVARSARIQSAAV